MRPKALAFSLVAIMCSGSTALGSARRVDVTTPSVVRWATVLCRFADTKKVPHPKSYYERLMAKDYPGLQHYWNDVSYGRMDFIATRARGWYDLPRKRRFYTRNEPYEVPERALEHCLKKADAHLYMPRYYGVNLWFSGALTNRGWGVRRPYKLDGRWRSYGVTIMSDPSTWTADNTAPQGILAHEMGHGFGLQHTAGGRRENFGSYWDVMSGIGAECGQQNLPEFSCLPVHPVAFQKRRLGWIRDEEVVVVRPGQTKTFFLKPLSETHLDGRLMAKVPLHGKIPGYFTVEARTPTGYDDKTLGEAIIIHRWDPTATQATGDHPYLIGRTFADGAVDWSGEMWQPGETYKHRRTGITISVLARSDDGRVELRVASP